MKTTALAVSLFVALAGAAFAQAPADPPEKTAVMANDRAFEAAYAKSDIKALLDLFTEDADYTSEDGLVFSGRAAIQDVFEAGAKGNPGAKLTIRTDSVRVLTPDVVLEKGSSEVEYKNGEKAGSLFSTTYVKKDGKWKISNLVETPLPDITPGEHLSELAWLVGDWEEADAEVGMTIHSHYQWARGGAFITRNVTVKRGDDLVLEGWQVIGWDPILKGIRSWTFDGAGGYTEGAWTREGNRWLVREKGYSGEGNRTTSEQTFSKASEDRFFWESSNRTMDGDPMPGIGRIQIQRVKGK